MRDARNSGNEQCREHCACGGFRDGNAVTGLKRRRLAGCTGFHERRAQVNAWHEAMKARRPRAKAATDVTSMKKLDADSMFPSAHRFSFGQRTEGRAVCSRSLRWYPRLTLRLLATDPHPTSPSTLPVCPESVMTQPGAQDACDFS